MKKLNIIILLFVSAIKLLTLDVKVIDPKILTFEGLNNLKNHQSLFINLLFQLKWAMNIF
jgi:hypothetical protein